MGNLIELFERAAYYGVFIALAVYLTSVGVLAFAALMILQRSSRAETLR